MKILDYRRFTQVLLFFLGRSAPPTRILTKVTCDFKEVEYIAFLIKALIFEEMGLNWRDLVGLYEYDSKEFRERFFNEFTHGDLKATLEAVGFDPDKVKGLFGYYNVYINTALRDALSGIPRQITKTYLDDTYYRLQNIDSYVDNIDRPLLLYFSQDDPILSTYKRNTDQPQTIISLLDKG